MISFYFQVSLNNLILMFCNTKVVARIWYGFINWIIVVGVLNQMWLFSQYRRIDYHTRLTIRYLDISRCTLNSIIWRLIARRMKIKWIATSVNDNGTKQRLKEWRYNSKSQKSDLTLKWGFGAMTLVRIEQSFWCFSNSSFESVPKIQLEFLPFFAFWHWYLHFSNFLACPLIWRVINRVPSGLFRNILGQYEHFVKPCSPWNRFSWEWAAWAVLNVLFSQNLFLDWRQYRVNYIFDEDFILKKKN